MLGVATLALGAFLPLDAAGLAGLFGALPGLLGAETAFLAAENNNNKKTQRIDVVFKTD